MKWIDLLALRRALRGLVVDWDDYVVHNLECLRNGCYFVAKVCDRSALDSVSAVYSVLTNLRFGQCDDELSPMPLTFLHFPHREDPSFENLPLYVRFNELEEYSPQRDESMTETLTAIGELGIFIRAAERCGGLEEFQAALQVLLSTMSQLALAYADYLK